VPWARKVAPPASRACVEDVDEEPADGLALGLGVGDALECGEEALGLVGVDQRDVVVIAEKADDLLGLAEAHQAGIDEDAGQLLADRLVDQDGGDRRIDAAGEPADHAAGADLLADARDRLVAVGRHGPVAGEAREAGEVRQQARAVRGVVDLRVELDAEEVSRGVADHREGGVRRGAEDLEAGGERGDAVAVAHPDLLAPFCEEALVDRMARMADGRDEGAAELAVVSRFDRAAELGHHQLLAVADAEDRHAEGEERLRARAGLPGRSPRRDRLRAPPPAARRPRGNLG
jgi:hypothetical protein